MTNKFLKLVEQTSLKEVKLEFRVGDTVDVHTRIVEGEKTRIQVFGGDVIMRRGTGTNAMFTVRRIVNGEGVERIFPDNSPLIEKVVVRRSGQTRRAKLYYLRDRVGKSTRLVERAKVKKKDVAAPAEEKELATVG